MLLIAPIQRRALDIVYKRDDPVEALELGEQYWPDNSAGPTLAMLFDVRKWNFKHFYPYL